MQTDELLMYMPDCYWVIPDVLAAGQYPRSNYAERDEKRFFALFEHGIRSFVDLTMPYDHISYAEMLAKFSREYGVTTEYRRFPIPDFDIPSIAEMKSILDYIDEHATKENKLYVHCHAGIGRTGTVVGCYLARHGLPREKRLDRIQELRRGTGSASIASPETSPQRDFVFSWPTNT